MSHLSRIEAQKVFFQWVAEVEAEKKAAAARPPPVPRRPVRVPPVVPRRPVIGRPAFPGLPSEYKQPERKYKKINVKTFDFKPNELSPFINLSEFKLRQTNIIRNELNNPITRAKLRRLNVDIEYGLIGDVKLQDIDNEYIQNIFELLSESKLNYLSRNMAATFIEALKESKYNMLSITKNDGTMTFRPINGTMDEFLTNYLMAETEYEHIQGSDAIYELRTFIASIVPYAENEEKKINPSSGRLYTNNSVRSVAFFDKLNKTDIDLSRYQIYTNKQIKELNGNIENCYIHSLAINGIEDSVLDSIKLRYQSGAHMPKSDFKEISTIINKKIILSFYDEKNVLRSTTYGTGEPIHLGIYNNHVFTNELSNYTMYSIKHYDRLKDLPDFNMIYTSTNRRSSDRFINSLQLIKLLDDNGHFVKSKIQISPHQKMNINLDNIMNEQQLIKETKINPHCKNIWFSDCEAFVSSGVHSLYLIGAVSINNDNVNVFNVCQSSEQKTVWSWLNAITNDGTTDALCYFHNLKYDYNILEKYLNVSSICQKDGNIYNVKMKYKNREIELRDSYKLLSVKLCQFSDMFNLGLNKLEAISYEYYTPENNNKMVESEVYRNLLKPTDQKIFDVAVQPYLMNNKFNPLKYYIDYLKNDCLVLKHGLIALNEILLGITDNNLGAFHKLTISSLTDTFMRLSGVFDGVYEMTGNLRAYCGKAAYGGRVHANEKYVGKIVNNKPIADFDSVSCYPSAIYRFNDELGLPTGPAQRIAESSLKDWELFHWCILTVRITKINKIQQMPIIAHRGKDSIDYLNEPPEEPVIIDKTTLEDYIKLHDIEYQVLDGIFWNGMPNKKWKNIIYNLFQERLKYKKTNKPLANTLKLMLNSAYGKCLIKASKQKTSIVKSVTSKKVDGKWVVNNPDNIGTYIKNNFNTIKSLRQMNDKQYEVQQIAIDTTYNRAHIASFILSMSKRIMNEIFYIANELQEPIFYQDTDSMHIYDESIEILQQEYKRVYGRELIGKQLGQFHPDFDNPPGFEGYMTSSAFLALGKKSYIDRLACNGIDTGHNHIRLKGITKLGIQHAIEQYEDAGISDGAWQLFNDLAEGKKKEILLNPILRDGTTGVMFDIAGGVIKTQKEFIRTLHFPNLNNE